jgi:hypothetical protein
MQQFILKQSFINVNVNVNVLVYKKHSEQKNIHNSI